jgi:hypothetical protein
MAEKIDDEWNRNFIKQKSEVADDLSKHDEEAF